MSPTIPSSPGGQKAQQTLTFTGTVTGGSIKLTHPSAGGVNSQPIPANPTAAQVQGALQGLPGLQNVQVSGNQGGPFTVTFESQHSGIGNQAITIASNNLTGTSPNMTIAVSRQGSASGGAIAGSGATPPENPHIVGAAGEVAYATGWSSPAGVSTTVTVPAEGAARTDHEPLQFFVDREGFVHIEGVAVWQAAAAALITTLPTGSSVPFDYAPVQEEESATNVEIRPDGTVSYMGSTASGGAVAVGPIVYRAKGV